MRRESSQSSDLPRIVCAVGAESTGKTALCRRLAEHFGVPWLPEYAREYFDRRTNQSSEADHAYQSSDVAAIAREQIRRERTLLAEADGGAVLDTDLAVILIWWWERFGQVPAWIEAAFAAQASRLYLLCRPDLPWQADRMRESPHDRPRLHELYRRLLTERQLPFVEIGGIGETRFEAAFAAAKPFLTTPTPSPQPPSSPPAP